MVINLGMRAFKYRKQILIKDESSFQSGIKEVVIKISTQTVQQLKLPQLWHVELGLSALILVAKALVERGTCSLLIYIR